MTQQTENWVPVDKYTRAPAEGQRAIKCPNCKKVGFVGHFSWTALSCMNCHEMVEKPDWLTPGVSS